MYVTLWKYFSRQIYSYNFHICKLNSLKVIDDLYSQYLNNVLKVNSLKVIDDLYSQYLNNVLNVNFFLC
jgi:hypothetical protein